MQILCFRELRVYQLAFELQQKIFELTKRFHREETYSLIDQIRRSSRSVGANIAEAWQKRRYPLHFVSKLTDSDSEQSETQHWLNTSLACNYITKEEYKELTTGYKSVGKMIGRMIAEPDKWCKPINK